MSEREDQVLSLKEQGNDCVRRQKFEEAVFHYTNGLKLDPKNISLYSNRSLVFLKLHQFHFAMEDALMTIQLNPQWTKGYFRKGEVEFHTFRFEDALRSYSKALALQPNDPNIMEAMNKASRCYIKDQRADQQIPWLGAGVGIILGVILVIADYVFTNKPTLTHPILMVLMTMSVSLLGFAIAKGCRYFVKCQRDSLLEPPLDLLGEEGQQQQQETDNDTGNKQSSDQDQRKSHAKYNKAQARQRLKKGKM